MRDELSLRSARICAGVSAALLTAVLLVGGIRSASEEENRPAATAESAGETAAFAADRNALRADEMEQLKEIASDPSASESLRASAQSRMMRLMEWMETEATMQEVLAARGFDAPVVTVHADSVNILVRAEALTREEAAVILELATRETGVTGGNVKIIPIN